MKYQIPNNQSETLPNILGLTKPKEISLSEFEGFLKAEIILTEELTNTTRFDLEYILNIHKLSLGHLYSFAGQLRDVNISKDGFPFASAQYLVQTMTTFDQEIFSKLKTKYESSETLIEAIAIVHSEFLLIHPFREGNGRTARILANLMSRQSGYGPLQFERIGDAEFEKYVTAIQKSIDKDYKAMIEIITSIFPD